MFTLEVLYAGKTYRHTAADSLTLIDALAARYGRIIASTSKEGYTTYRTTLGATAWLFQ